MTPSTDLNDVYVRIANVSVTFRSASGHQVDALQSVSLDLPKRAFVALAGPSGSGKSTMLYVLAGLLRASTGTVRVGELDLGGRTAEQLARFRCMSVGFIFQSFQLLPHLRAWENVALPMLALGVEPGERQRRACRLLSEFGLGARINHRPGELSAGEQQRVAIARAIINSPSLVLADEPTGNLDGANAELISAQLEELVGRLGATVICATHDDRLAARARLIARMAHGRVSVVEDHA